MLLSLIIVSLASLTFSSTIPAFTRNSDFLEWSGRIIGGQTAKPGQFPYQTSMRSTSNDHFCGGFIINLQWVGCVAHCTIFRTAQSMVVVVGAHSRLTGGTTHRVSEIINHEEYSHSTLINDISVVRLEIAITETILAQPIPLGSKYIEDGLAIGSGWGTTVLWGSLPEDLQFLEVKVIRNELCRSLHSETHSKLVFESTLCTSSPTGQGMCHGDSGSPLTQNGQVIGAVSWGVPCALGVPDQFARIAYFRDWINKNIAS